MTGYPVKTAVIGASGYVGRYLLRAYRAKYPDCVGTSFSANHPDLQRFDLRYPDLGALDLEQTGHEAVLIAAAKPNIGYCEQHPEDSYAVNVRGTLELVDQIAGTSMQVIFLSSDYVFDGTRGGYEDDAPAKPSTKYGQQKAEVERELSSRADKWLVFRLSKIFGVEKHDGTLLDEIGTALAAREPIRVATNQRFSPTLVTDLATVSLSIQSMGLNGIHNICGDEARTRYELATELAQAMGADTDLIEPVSLHDLPGMAGRPLDTSMSCTRLGSEARLEFTSLSDSIRRVAENWAVTG